MSLVERHRRGGTFFLLGKWYNVRHLKQRKEAQYARILGDSRIDGCGIPHVSRRQGNVQKVKGGVKC